MNDLRKLSTAFAQRRTTQVIKKDICTLPVFDGEALEDAMLKGASNRKGMDNV